MGTAQQMADWIAEFSGTITFFSLNALVFLIWITTNTLLPRPLHFDAYPFQFLTMAVSLEAIFLSIFVLISQNHQSKKDRITAELDYQTDVHNGKVLEKMSIQIEKVQVVQVILGDQMDRIEQKLDQLLTMYNRRRKVDDRRGTTPNDSAGAGQSLESTALNTDPADDGRDGTNAETASAEATAPLVTNSTNGYVYGDPTPAYHVIHES